MDTYTTVEALLADTAPVRQWPDMHRVLRRACAGRPQAWELPVIASLAVGGSAEQALPASAAVAALQTSIILLDDALDDDPRGEQRRLGGPAAANLAAAFQALALDVLAHSGASTPTLEAALRCLNGMALSTAWGQYLDTQNPADEDAYWRVVVAKSSPFFAAALESGALLGGASIGQAENIGRLGRVYGEMIQIHDDLQDSMETPANPDWLQGRCSLPILFAQTVAHPERARFLVVRAAAADPECLAEAQAILIRCGAVSYAVHGLLARHQAAQTQLRHMRLPSAAGLRRMLAATIKPLQRWTGRQWPGSGEAE